MMDVRVSSNLTRVEELELRATASSRVIAASSASVAFIQGAYGFRERSGDRMLRQLVRSDGVPWLTPRGLPVLSLEGDGPVVELQYTGTGFVVGDEGFLITNRHIPLPWEQNSSSAMLVSEDVEPVIMKLVAYLPGYSNAVPVSLRLASENADIAILERGDALTTMHGRHLAEITPTSGDEVIVMGYPTGLRSMLAQSGPDFIKQLQESANTDFWSVAAKLAEGGHVAPLASRGIGGHVTPNAIVYDAETPMAAAEDRY